jgi:hypothetical protein
MPKDLRDWDIVYSVSIVYINGKFCPLVLIFIPTRKPWQQLSIHSNKISLWRKGGRHHNWNLVNFN